MAIFKPALWQPYSSLEVKTINAQRRDEGATSALTTPDPKLATQQSRALNQSHIAETKFIVETDHLSRVISGKRLVDDITIGIQKGEILAVVGHSGSGKSSFLRAS